MAQTFSFIDEEKAVGLSEYSYVDTMVTVVDCFNFHKDFGSGELLKDRDLTNIEHDERTIVNLLTEQIEFADVIILNKTDLISAETITFLRAVIKKLNPGAKIIESMFGKVDPKEILNTGRFDFEVASRSAGWIQELNNVHTPETEEYGISSVVFREKRPFHPERFMRFLQEEFPENIIRSKGLFWLADRPDDALNFSQAGGSSRLEPAGVWWSSMSYDQRLAYSDFRENQSLIESKWHKDFGDRETELVFIGQHIDKNALILQLENCLLDESEVLAFKAGKYDIKPLRNSG